MKTATTTSSCGGAQDRGGDRRPRPRTCSGAFPRIQPAARSSSSWRTAVLGPAGKQAREVAYLFRVMVMVSAKATVAEAHF